ncbi:MAG: ankyrin repeat domain-containing protein [Terriglobales bacterium]
MANILPMRVSVVRAVQIAAVMAIVLWPAGGWAQGGIPVEFKPAIEQKVDARSSPAKVTGEEASALTSKGYVQIGTIRAVQPGKKTNAEVTEQQESAILQKAAEAGGDVVRFSKEGVFETTWVPTGKTKTKRDCLDSKTVQVSGAPQCTKSCYTDIHGFQHCNDVGCAPSSTTRTQCVKWGEPETVPVTKREQGLVSEGTVWRYDPKLAPVVLRARAKSDFIEVLRTSDLAEIRNLLNEDPSLVAVRGENKLSPLQWAAEDGRKDVAELLLSKGADVNARGDLIDCSPLCYAARRGHKDVVELLLSKGAIVDSEDLNVASTDVAELLNHTKYTAENKPVTVLVGKNSIHLAVNPVTNRVYAPISEGSKVTVIDGATNIIAATVPVGKDPWGVAVNPVTNKIYITNEGAEVTVIDGATNTISATVPVGYIPWLVAVNTATNRIYVAAGKKDKLKVIDGTTNAISARITIRDNPDGLAVNPATNKIYVVPSDSNEVTVIDGATNTISATVPIGKHGGALKALAVNPVTNKIYVVNGWDKEVAVIGGVTNTISATVQVGDYPVGVTVNPATNKIYVADNNDRHLTVIDGATNTASTVPAELADHCGDVAVNSSTNKIYVSHHENVYIIDVGPAAASPSTSRLLSDPNLSAKINQAAGKSPLQVLTKRLKDNPEYVRSKKGEGVSTPLHTAVHDGHKDEAELLLAHGADVNAKDNDGWTPLHEAATRDVAELLLAHGADVNARNTDRDNDGMTPLHFAAVMGKKDVAEVLLAHGANVNAKNGKFETPLHLAAYKGDRGVVELLLAHGADVNSKEYQGMTPLHSAAMQGNADVIELLLAHGAGVNAKDNNGFTPLVCAEVTKHQDTVDLLREHGGHK